MSKANLRSEILRELNYESRNNIAAICTYINNKTRYNVPNYGTKEQLLRGIEGVDPCVLEAAMDAVLDTEIDCDDDDEIEDEDETEDDESEEEDCDCEDHDNSDDDED